MVSKWSWWTPPRHREKTYTYDSNRATSCAGSAAGSAPWHSGLGSLDGLAAPVKQETGAVSIRNRIAVARMSLYDANEVDPDL